MRGLNFLFPPCEAFTERLFPFSVLDDSHSTSIFHVLPLCSWTPRGLSSWRTLHVVLCLAQEQLQIGKARLRSWSELYFSVCDGRISVLDGVFRCTARKQPANRRKTINVKSAMKLRGPEISTPSFVSNIILHFELSLPRPHGC